MRIHERSAAVALVDGRIGLDECSRPASVSRIRIRTIQAAHNSARDGKREVAERVSKRKHCLAGMQLRRVTPRNACQVLGIDLDHSNVVQLVDADYLRRKYA